MNFLTIVQRSAPLFTAAFVLGLSQHAVAQSITTAPDGTGTIIEYNGNTYHITGGTQAGANLFHSFQEFGLQPSEIADFLSNPAIQNVVGRVVGGNPSVIEGLIRLSGGNSNLFLVNPAGWVFTSGASVDVPGSFGVSTASRIGFGSEFFNAIGENNYATLTGDPTSLIFDQSQPGAIVTAADLNINNGSFWMIGGSVISTGEMTTPNGTVTLAAVPGESKVKLTHEGMALGLILDALPATEVREGMPLGLSATDLPRYLTGGSHIGNAENFAIAADGTVYLIGSESRVEDGQVVIGDKITAENVDLIAADRVQITDPALVQGDTTVVRLPAVGGTNTLSVIDSRADNPYFLLYGGAQGTISKIINRDEDGVEVISTELTDIAEQGGQVDAVSITAEGHEGNFWLGNTWITDESVANYSEQLVAWRDALTESADLLLYSCFTALGATGNALISSLASLTGADVAASTNATGSANYEGDWVLERSTGSIEVATPFTDETLAVWDGKLATLTVTSSADAGAGTLRQRIQTDATNGDMITFDSARTMTLANNDIDWTTDNLTLDGNGSTVDGGGGDRVFDLNGVNATINNMTITNGSIGDDGGGIRHQGAGSLTLTNTTISGNSAGGTGGGLYIDIGNLIISNTTIAGNSSNDTGGGIDAGSTSVMIVNSTLSNNSANSVAGGVDIDDGRLTIINSTISDNSANGSGGGISADDGNVTLMNSTISGNSADGSGGGVDVSDASITVRSSTISGNSADANGGGLQSDGGVITVTNSTISVNSADGDGGGIDSDSTAIITDSIISGNSAADNGGGIYNDDSSTVVSRSTISNNSANHGGGIFTDNGSVTVNTSTISGNSVSNNGGGIYADDGGITITSSTVSGNSAGVYGGGLHADNTGANITLTNSTISGNSATNNGGGISLQASGNVTATNATIAFNTSGTSGGGIYLNAGGTGSLRNTIVSDNTAGGSGSDLFGTFTANHSLILNSSGATISGSNNIFNQDPLLQPLAFNGGSATQTHALDFRSPAINAGSNDFASGLTFDQSQIYGRIFGGTVDIGAYEVNPDYQAHPFSFAEVYLDPLFITRLLVDGGLGMNACQTVPKIDLNDEDIEHNDELEEVKTHELEVLDENCRPISTE